MPKASACALYCDDVRVEQSGKIIAIGIYGSDIVLSDQSSEQLTLCAVVRVIGPSEIPFSNIKIEHFYNDTSLGVNEIDSSQMGMMQHQHQQEMGLFELASSGLAKKATGVLLHGFTRFSITSPEPIGLLTTVIDMGNGPIDAGSIPVRVTMNLPQQLLNKAELASEIS